MLTFIYIFGVAFLIVCGLVFLKTRNIFKLSVKVGDIYYYVGTPNPFTDDYVEAEILDTKNGFVKYRYYDKQGNSTGNTRTVSSFLESYKFVRSAKSTNFSDLNEGLGDS